jgi:hypothetical protein
MARVGQSENTAAQKNFSSEQQQSFGNAQSDIGRFRQNQDVLNRGGQVVANPWKSAGYLSNVNRLQSGALNSEENAGNDAIARTNRRTGGLNTGATIGAEKELGLDKMRLGSQLSAERSAGDFGRNISYQTNMAAMPLEAARAESPYFGGAVSGQSGALKNLTDYGLASYGPYMAALQAAGAAASGGLQAAFMPRGPGTSSGGGGGGSKG